jgi:hypothetical protein
MKWFEVNDSLQSLSLLNDDDNESSKVQFLKRSTLKLITDKKLLRRHMRRVYKVFHELGHFAPLGIQIVS